MPSELPDDFQKLIRAMLQTDPKQRIIMEAIKHRPVFRIGIPKQYGFPGPLPFPEHIDPINPEEIEGPIFEILHQIGFGTEEELIEQLKSEEKTAPKLFYIMLTRNFSIDQLPWPTHQDEEPIPNSNSSETLSNITSSSEKSSFNLFSHSPEIMITDSSDFNSNFNDYNLYSKNSQNLSSSESLSVYSFAEREDWGMDQIPPVPIMHTETIQNIIVPLEYAISVIQKRFSEERIDWFYPSDIELFARKQKPTIIDIHVQAQYDQDSNLNIVFHLIQGDPNYFIRFVDSVKQRIKEINI